jgi:hypothetical protein
MKAKPTLLLRLRLVMSPLALVAATALVGLGAGARAQTPAAPAAPAASPAAPTNCKTAGGKCCDPAVAIHLPKEAIFSACGESPATFQGEKGSKDTCRYVFKNEKGEEAFVEVYAPAAKEVPDYPSDPFFGWKKVGKVFITDSAKSPKSAPMLANATGLWMPGQGYTVSVNASTKICTKAEVARLAKSVR